MSGKPVFIVSDQGYSAAHSGKLLHCSTCNQGAATKQFYLNKHSKPDCNMFQSEDLLRSKGAGVKTKTNTTTFPMAAPVGKPPRGMGLSCPRTSSWPMGTC